MHTKMAIIRNSDNSKCWQPEYSSVTSVATLENRLAISQTVMYRVTIQSNNSTPRHLPERNENICPHKTCPQMFIAALLIIAKK